MAPSTPPTSNIAVVTVQEEVRHQINNEQRPDQRCDPGQPIGEELLDVEALPAGDAAGRRNECRAVGGAKRRIERIRNPQDLGGRPLGDDHEFQRFRQREQKDDADGERRRTADDELRLPTVTRLQKAGDDRRQHGAHRQTDLGDDDQGHTPPSPMPVRNRSASN
jgi:hypothetical protein